jgi:hypothetical protein
MRTAQMAIVAWGLSAIAIGQVSDSHARMQELVASLNKEKYEVKEKFGVRKEKYKRIKTEPVIKSDPRDYAGFYEVPDLGNVIELKADINGRLVGSGYESIADRPHRFRLDGIKISEALFTAIKVYDDGASGKLEAVFITKTEFNSLADKGVRSEGLAMVGTPESATAKLFYQKKHE